MFIARERTGDVTRFRGDPSRRLSRREERKDIATPPPVSNNDDQKPCHSLHSSYSLGICSS